MFQVEDDPLKGQGGDHRVDRRSFLISLRLPSPVRRLLRAFLSNSAARVSLAGYAGAGFVRVRP